MKKTATLLLSLAVLGVGAGAGLLLQPSEQVLADEPVANTQYELEQTDFSGNKVKVPVYYDGEKYILADYTRNIFVFDASTAKYDIFDESSGLYYNPVHNKLPAYTSANGQFNDKLAITEYNNVIKAYNFYSENFGWNGVYGTNDNVSGNWVENNERQIHLFVHADCEGYEYNNAEYMPAKHNGQAYDYVLVGDSGSFMEYQGRALDLIGHELQHGVTDALGYSGGPGDKGAFDEASSDMFGMLIEGKNINSEDFWTLAEDGLMSQYLYLRSAKDPTSATGYAATVDTRNTCTHSYHGVDCDYGFSHYNATVFTHLQYTVWRSLPEYFTPERIGNLWWELIKLMAEEKASNLNNNCWETFGLNMLKAAETLEFSQEAQTAIRNSLITNGFLEGEISTPPVEEDPPVENPPVENPPVEEPPVENPPVENPPVENPPVENPPTTEKKSSGCGGVIGIGAAAIAAVIILSGAGLLLKRKQD